MKENVSGCFFSEQSV